MRTRLGFFCYVFVLTMTTRSKVRSGSSKEMNLIKLPNYHRFIRIIKMYRRFEMINITFNNNNFRLLFISQTSLKDNFFYTYLNVNIYLFI